MNLSEDGRASVHPPEDREEALDALDEVVGLVLPPGRWAKVVHALGSLEAAIGSGDTEALRTATGLLENAGGHQGPYADRRGRRVGVAGRAGPGRPAGALAARRSPGRRTGRRAGPW
ncbi:CATRA system-associated protein [Streptomyces rhizosphaericola]|uniref:CATRA system-associated protein n=1 Tax=Streptomyces rhizosphaericola TaxID=2564098 RepID=UPI003B8A90AE